MKALLATLLWLPASVLSLAQTTPSDQELSSRADEYMNNLVKLDHFSGSVLVARHARVVLSKGYGLANLELNAPNTPDTKFRIGSITKQFTAMAVVILQEQGKLGTGDSICRYVIPCPAFWRPITIHELLTHTSGIPSFTDFPDNDDFERKAMTLLATIDRFKNLPLEFKPGEKFNYSDSGYTLLAYVIEKASGLSYEAFLHQNIYQPLHMMDSGYDHPRAILKQRATGYLREGDIVVNNSHYFEMDTPCGAGSQYSTVKDLYLWDRALYTEKLVSQKTLDAIFTAFAPQSYQWHGYFGYGYGWMVGQLFGQRTVWHDGGINGFVSYLGRFPDDDLSIIILSNREDSFVRRASMDLTAIAFGKEYHLPAAAIEIKPAILDAYLGKYKFEDGRVFTVVRQGNSIRLEGAKVALIPQSETEFLSGGGGRFAFVKDKNGQVTHILITGNVAAKRL